MTETTTSTQQATLPIPEVIPPFPKRKMGPPFTYDAELVNQICEAISGGATLRATCRKLNFCEGTFRNWVVNDLEGLATRYARCRLAQSEAWADDLIEIGDDTSNDTIITEAGERPNAEWIARSRLRCDNRKWLMARCNPLFADKSMVAIAGGIYGSQQEPQGSPVEIARRLAAALTRGAEQQDDQP